VIRTSGDCSGRPRVGEPVPVAGRVERGHRDLVDADVVGVLVERALVAVGDQDLRLLPADDLDELPDRLAERCVGEVVAVCVRLGAGHARVAVPEQVQLVVADRIDAGAQLGHAHRAEVGSHLGRVGGRVEDVALLAAGAAHERGADALARVARHRARALRRLVVGMRVHRHEPERVAGVIERARHPVRRYLP
jgi:hypothetical protein